MKETFGPSATQLQASLAADFSLRLAALDGGKVLPEVWQNHWRS